MHSTQYHTGDDSCALGTNLLLQAGVSASLMGSDFLQAKLDSLDAEQPAADKTTSTTSLTWRGITYQVRNVRIRANLQQVAEMSQQQQDGMQTDQAAHEVGQYDALIGALIETKASLGSVLKTTPGVCTASCKGNHCVHAFLCKSASSA